MLSIGGWGEGTGPQDRAALALEVVMGTTAVVSVVDPSGSPFFGEDILGRLWGPEELMDEDAARAVAQVKLVLDRDPRLAAHLRAWVAARA